MHELTHRFQQWYERHERVHTFAAAGLFLLQIVHLTWLTLHVVAMRLLGQSYFQAPPFWQYILIAVDYTEIPALLTTSLLYLYDLSKEFRWKSLLYLLFINTQWLHLFWITDEFVISQFTAAPGSTVLPVWLAWIAIFIDYLELPVIVDTLRRALKYLFVVRS